MKITKPEHLDKLDKDGLIAFLNSDREDKIRLWNAWRKPKRSWPIDLSEASLVEANLEGAFLDMANLAGAELSEAHLEGAILRMAHLEGTTLQEANLQRADLSRANLRKANMSMGNLEKANLDRACLEEADLGGACLDRANLDGANLKKTSLSVAHLKEASITLVNLEEANLRGAHLQGVALSNVADGGLRKVKLYQTYLRGVLSLRYEQFLSDNKNATGLRRFWLRLWNRLYESTIWEETEGRFDEAKDVFKTLKGYFEDAGDYEGANWAYVREQVMEKLMRAPGWVRWLYPRWHNSLGAEHREPAFCEWFWLGFAEKAANYGTGVLRPIFWLTIVVLLFALIYCASGAITSMPGCSYAELAQSWRDGCAPTHNPLDALLFSFGALTSTEIGAVRPYLSHVGIPMTVEVLLGIALTGLFGFVLGNKLRYS